MKNHSTNKELEESLILSKELISTLDKGIDGKPVEYAFRIGVSCLCALLCYFIENIIKQGGIDVQSQLMEDISLNVINNLKDATNHVVYN